MKGMTDNRHILDLISNELLENSRITGLDGVFRIDRLDSLLSEFLRARTESALVKIEDDGSNEAIKQIMSFKLTEKGAFVREILLQEFAKIN